MGFKYCTSEFSWAKFYLIEHFDLVYRIMFAKGFNAKILRLEIFLILETIKIRLKKRSHSSFDLGRFILLNMRV